MLDHVFTDAIGALRDAFDAAFLERQPFEEHFQADVLLGDLTWETSYGLPGEGMPPRVVAHITFDWPTWSQTAYRQWYVEEVLERLPAIEIEVVFRMQGLHGPADAAIVFTHTPTTSPLIGDGRLERAGITLETSYVAADDDADATADGGRDVPAGEEAPDNSGAAPVGDLHPEYAVEVTYEGLYELAEVSLDDGTSALLDEHLGALGGWIAATLVRLADL